VSERFRLALQRVSAAQWQLFERLASVFLADEHGSLRTLASESGDEGRDAIIYQTEDDQQSPFSIRCNETGPRKFGERHEGWLTVILMSAY
jgi:hypothetical protein